MISSSRRNKKATKAQGQGAAVFHRKAVQSIRSSASNREIRSSSPPPTGCPVLLLSTGQPPPSFTGGDNRLAMGYRILVLQHCEWRQPGSILHQAAQTNNVILHIARAWKESAADFAEFDALIILGGPDHLNQEHQRPFLREEKRLVRAWMNLNKPCLGFNLGQHLLAEAAGATIGPSRPPHVGFSEGHLTHEGKKHPLFQGLRSPFPLFKWHDQEIQSPLPRNMVLLATSKDCMVEACCLEGRPHIIGLQCDNYAGTREDVDAWSKRDDALLKACTDRSGTTNELFATADRLAAGMATTCSLLLRNFVALLNP